MDERLSLASDDTGTIAQHLARYEFAGRYAGGKRVADAACGTGYGSTYLVGGGAESYLGLDISPAAIEECRAKYPHPKAEFRRKSVLELGDAGKFDLIVSYETIEHITQYEEFLRQVKRSLEPGGTFIVSSPIRQRGELSDKPANPFHTQEWSEAEFLALLEGHFTVQEVYYQYGHRHPCVRSGEAWTRRFWRLVAPAGYAEVAKYPVVRSARELPTPIPIKPIFILAVCGARPG